MTQRVILHHADTDAPDIILEHPGPMTDREFELWAAGIRAAAQAVARALGNPDTIIGPPIIDPCP